MSGADADTMTVEVAWATPETQQIVTLTVPRGSTAREVIEASGIRIRFPEIEPEPDVGIFSRRITLDQVLSEGDRVEIYRPLIADPKEVRRQKAERERGRG